MTTDYGDFACCSSAASGYHAIFREGRRHKFAARQDAATALRHARRTCLNGISGSGQWTPSFFCKLDDDVVYWNTSRLSG